MSNKWESISRDDIQEHLVVYVSDWLDEHNIADINDFNESFQSDSFQEDVEDFATEVVRAVLKLKEPTT